MGLMILMALMGLVRLVVLMSLVSLVSLVALVALVGWTGVSIVWSRMAVGVGRWSVARYLMSRSGLQIGVGRRSYGRRGCPWIRTRGV